MCFCSCTLFPRRLVSPAKIFARSHQRRHKLLSTFHHLGVAWKQSLYSIACCLHYVALLSAYWQSSVDLLNYRESSLCDGGVGQIAIWYCSHSWSLRSSIIIMLTRLPPDLLARSRELLCAEIFCFFQFKLRVRV